MRGRACRCILPEISHEISPFGFILFFVDMALCRTASAVFTYFQKKYILKERERELEKEKERNPVKSAHVWGGYGSQKDYCATSANYESDSNAPFCTIRPNAVGNSVREATL